MCCNKMYNACSILLLIVALRAVAPKLVSTTPMMRKYFYNPVDAVFELFSSIVKLLINFFTQALIKGVSDAIRWVVRNLILLVMALLFFYSIFQYIREHTDIKGVVAVAMVVMILWLMSNFRDMLRSLFQ
jgi:ABC-type amino acid transport system permease subunit